MDDRDWLVEYATGSVSNRHQMCTLKEWPKILAEEASRKQEIYRSMWLFDESARAFIDTTGTLSGFQGIRYLDQIYLDIDVKGNIEYMGDSTIESVLTLIDVLNGKGVDTNLIQVWFSGRGFHLHLPNIYDFQPDPKLHKIVRATIARDFGKHIDLIYDATRIFRAPYSKNRKTGAFKNPLKIEELESMTYDQILKKSMEIRTDYKPDKIDLGEKGFQTWEPASIKQTKENKAELIKAFDGANTERSRTITCAQHIYWQGDPPVGTRHTTLLRVVSIAIRHWGLDQAGAQAVAQAYMDRCTNPLPKTEVSKVVQQVWKVGGYKYKCSDEILSKYCDPKCSWYYRKNLEEDQHNIIAGKDAVHDLFEYLRTDMTDKSFDLKEVFPFMHNSYIFKEGDLAIFQGDTKLGKTALCQYIVSEQKEVKSLYLSLEVDRNTIMRRFVQQLTGKTKDEIQDLADQHDPEAEKAIQGIVNHLDVSTTAPDIKDFPEMIRNSGAKIIVVDTVDAVPNRYSGKRDSIAQQDFMYEQLKKIAIAEEVIILAVVHISKGAHYRLKEGEMLDVHSTKGSSAVSQKADKVIAFEGFDEGSKKRRIRTVASRDESGFNIVVDYDWNTFRFEART